MINCSIYPLLTEFTLKNEVNMVDLIIQDVGRLQFDPQNVPTFYQWSGYTKNAEE